MLASLLAILSMPLVTWLQRHRIPMVIAVLCAVLIDLVILAAFAALLAIGVKEMLAVPEKYEASIARLIRTGDAALREDGAGSDEYLAP